jgi:hypothetical protein
VSMQIYFFIQMNRIAAPRVTPLSLRNIVRRGDPSVPFSGQRIQILQVALDFSRRTTRMRPSCATIVLKWRALAPGLLQSRESIRVRYSDNSPSPDCTARQAVLQVAEE